MHIGVVQELLGDTWRFVHNFEQKTFVLNTWHAHVKVDIFGGEHEVTVVVELLGDYGRQEKMRKRMEFDDWVFECELMVHQRQTLLQLLGHCVQIPFDFVHLMRFVLHGV